MRTFFRCFLGFLASGLVMLANYFVILHPSLNEFRRMRIRSWLEGTAFPDSYSVFRFMLLVIGSGACCLSAIYFAKLALLPQRSQKEATGSRVIRMLRFVQWMFGPANRLNVQHCIDDLGRDRNEMVAMGCSRFYIQGCLLKRTGICMITIVWSAFMTLLTEVAGAAKLIWQILGKG